MAQHYLDKGNGIILALMLKTDDTAASLDSIVAGNYDADLQALAEAIRSDGRTIVLRPLYEFNGDWYPWQAYFKGNTPGTFIAAWRHVVSLFRSANAPVLFDLNYNRLSAGAHGHGDFETLYPGDAWVDSVSISSYNRCGSSRHHTQWKPFREEFGPAYNTVARFSTKPIGVAETSSTSLCGGDKAAWITELFSDVASRYPKVNAITFYLGTKDVGTASNTDDLHWELETDTQQDAFTRGVAALRKVRGVCPSGSVVGIRAAPLAPREPKDWWSVGTFNLPWSMQIEGRSYVAQTYNDALNPVTNEPFGTIGSMLHWRLKQALTFDMLGGTLGPHVSYQGYASNNPNMWWFNYHGLGTGLEYCTEHGAGDWGTLCGGINYEHRFYTAPVPERLMGGEDGVFLNLRFNAGGDWNR
jgi:hypothetical protein